jgi:superfamily II DNA or RNA helicase/mRNA-degrading endonuclease RelE of RelBE toxin-antitoxin system
MTSPASPEPQGEAIGAGLWAPVLRGYQRDAGAALETSFFEDGKNRLLFKKPTGTGKTVWFAALLGRAFPKFAAWLAQFKDQKGAKVLVIAHREELLQQAAEKISRGNRGVMVSIEQAGSVANRYSDVIVAGIQTLSARKFHRLKKLLRYHTFRLVVIDEAHHAAAASYRTALVILGFLPAADASDENEIEAVKETDVAVMARNLDAWDREAPKDRLLVGVTATPNRTDAIGLSCVFQKIAYAYELKQAIEDGYLVPIVPWVVETTANLDAVHTSRGDFNQRELAEVVNIESRNRLTVEAWSNYAADLQTIVFAVSVDHAHQLAKAYKAIGVKFEAVSGETDTWRRRDMMREFRRGDLQGFVNCMVLTEGTDLPTAACIVHAKPTKSATLYEQMTGRGLRTHPDDPVGPERLAAIARGDAMKKPSCILIDVVDVARKHSLQTAPVLYGLPPNVSASGKDLRDLAAALEDLIERTPGLDPEALGGRFTMQDLEVRASTFDIFSVPSMGKAGAGLKYQWVRVRADEYRLQYPWQDGTEILTVTRDVLGHYTLSATLRPADGSPARHRVIVPEVPDLRRALQIAELFILNDRRSTTAILSRSASWRSRPISDGQIGLLRALRAPVRSNMTMGQASALIEIYKVKRGRR